MNIHMPILSISNDGNSVADLNGHILYHLMGGQLDLPIQSPNLEPRQNQTVRLGVIPPLNQEITESAFKISISVKASNGEREYE